MPKKQKIEGAKSNRHLHGGRSLDAVFATEIQDRPLQVNNVVAQNIFVEYDQNGGRRFVIGNGDEKKVDDNT